MGEIPISGNSKECVVCGGFVGGNRPDSKYCKKRVCKNVRQKEYRISRGEVGKYYLPPKIRYSVDRVNEIKSTTPCTDCGGIFPFECMDFDHLRDKVKGVSELLYAGRSWDEIQLEIDKCELVCANCHRIRTRKRLLDNNDKGKWEIND